MLPLMIVTGFILQRPLDRAMKRLQAKSAARHGVLVETLSGLETIRATGAEARMQTAWERSVAATARSGEDVHFWSSLSLTSANVAQQITSLSLLVIGVFLILDGKLTVGALVAANMLGGPRACTHCRDCFGDHPRNPNPDVTQIDRPHHVAGARAVARAGLRFTEDRRRADRFRECNLCLSERPRQRAGKGLVQNRRRRKSRHHRSGRIGQDYIRASAAWLL